VIPDVTSIWQRVQKRKKGVAALFLVGGLAMPGSRRKAIGLRPRCSMLRGAEVGSVKLNGDTGGVRIRAEVSGLPAGFHGFHIHAVGTCTPPFTTVGGHWNPEGQTHPSHAGDQPVLLVNANGTGSLSFVSDRYGISDLFDADGNAFIVHASPDNYANVYRYGTPRRHHTCHG
jgi:superoxide dismutase, Cu-Zn family